MRKVQDRQRIVQSIARAAQAYRSHLVGKRFMYVFDRRYIEVIYKAENFKHLTGVASALSARRFFSYACRRMLAASQIDFNAQHPYALCVRKIGHIEELARMATSECLMLEEITTQTRSYRFGTTDLSFTLCMNRETDDAGQLKGDCYVVQSLRDEDCFAKSRDVYEVMYIFERPNDKKAYSAVMYRDPRADASCLTDEIRAMLEDGLL